MDLDRLEELAKNAPRSPYDETGQWHAEREWRLDDLQRSIEPQDVLQLIAVARAALAYRAKVQAPEDHDDDLTKQWEALRASLDALE